MADTAAGTSPLQIESSRTPTVTQRSMLDWQSFVYIVIAVLTALAVLATVEHSQTMLTRISIGVLIALALDPVADSIERRLNGRRGLAVALGGEPLGEPTPCDSALVSSAEPAEQAKRDLDEASGRTYRSDPEWRSSCSVLPPSSWACSVRAP